jgi:uncharacterized protein (DUF362 family)
VVTRWLLAVCQVALATITPLAAQETGAVGSARAWLESAPPADAAPSPPAAPKSRVFFALMPAAVQGGVLRPALVKRMVDSVVMAAAGQQDIAAAWRTFVSPQDRVGIKVSTSAAPVSGTHPEVVAAVAEGLVAAGVDPGRIVIWDRLQRDMDRAGFGELARRFRVVSTEEAGGYAENATVIAAMMGRLISGDRGFNPGPGDQMSSKSHLSSVLVDDVDKVVHVPSLTDSSFSGIHGAVAGMVLDNMDNWRRLARAPHFGDPYLPELYADPRIGGKVVLTILDALRPQYAGGPFPGAEYRANYGAIFASRDAVALDATGLRLLDDFRKEAGMPLLGETIGWPDSAEVMGVGTAAEEGIELLRTGLESEVNWSRP